jgi:hypothetical protein
VDLHLRKFLETLSREELYRFVEAFFALKDAHYGVSNTHIGDGDGLSDEDAEEIKGLYSKYGEKYWGYKTRAKTFLDM